MGVFVRRLLLLLIFPTPLVLAFFLQQHPYFFVHLKNVFSVFKNKKPNGDFLLRAART